MVNKSTKDTDKATKESNKFSANEKKPSKDGEKALGMLIALMGAAMGQSVTSQYGVQSDASPKKILQNEDVRYILGLDDLDNGVGDGNHLDEEVEGECYEDNIPG